MVLGKFAEYTPSDNVMGLLQRVAPRRWRVTFRPELHASLQVVTAGPHESDSFTVIALYYN